MIRNSMVRSGALRGVVAAMLLVTLTSCDALKDPYEEWIRDITYSEENGEFKVFPTDIEGDGPVGFVVINNETFVERGFAIPDLALYEKIGPDSQKRITVEEARDGRTYDMFENEVSEKKFGTLTMKYRSEDER